MINTHDIFTWAYFIFQRKKYVSLHTNWFCFGQFQTHTVCSRFSRKNHHVMSKFSDRVIIIGEDSVLYLYVSCLYKLI